MHGQQLFSVSKIAIRTGVSPKRIFQNMREKNVEPALLLDDAMYFSEGQVAVLAPAEEKPAAARKSDRGE